jgi:hypothetical protein
MHVEVVELLQELASATLHAEMHAEMQVALAALCEQAEKLSEIANRLQEADLLGGVHGGPNSRAGYECADVSIVLVQLASALGVDLQPHVNRKMCINRNRRWKKIDSGRYQHV